MEVWKQTQYANYEVSSLGRVRNIKTGNVLQCSVGSSNDYRRVSMNGKTIEVHRLVAIAFYGYQAGMVVHHLDEDKLNNEVSNLKWATQKENVQHSLKPRVMNPKFSDSEKQYIKDLYQNGISCIKITKHCNVLWSRTTTRATYTRIAKN